MAEEQVRIDLTANDQASRKIDEVAGNVEALEGLDPEVTVTADDNASRPLDAIATAAEQLDRADPEVHVTADDDASRVLEGIADEAHQLTRADQELVLKARIDDARAGLKTLRDDLDTTADQARRTEDKLDDIGRSRGPGLAGNSIADMTGPLGDVSGAASDIAGVFDGLGDVTENLASRVGVDAEEMAGAITGIGFAVTAAAAAWAYYRQRQQAAREAQAELVRGQREFNRALDEGDRAAAAAKFAELYEDALDAAARFGVSAETATRFIRGQTDGLGDLDQEIRRVSAAIDENGGKNAAANNQQSAYLSTLTETRDQLERNRASYRSANGELAEQDRRLDGVSRALGKAADDADEFATSQDRVEESTRRVNSEIDRMKGSLDIEQSMNDFKRAVIDAMNEVGESALDQSDDVIALKQSVIDMGEQFKRNPLEIAAVVKDVEAGNLAAVSRTVQYWYEQNPIILASKLDLPRLVSGGLTGTRPGAGPQSIAPEIGTVVMSLPAGWRGDPLASARGVRRRSGRYFNRVA